MSHFLFSESSNIISFLRVFVKQNLCFWLFWFEIGDNLRFSWRIDTSQILDTLFLFLWRRAGADAWERVSFAGGTFPGSALLAPPATRVAPCQTVPPSILHTYVRNFLSTLRFCPSPQYQACLFAPVASVIIWHSSPSHTLTPRATHDVLLCGFSNLLQKTS